MVNFLENWVEDFVGKSKRKKGKNCKSGRKGIWIPPQVGAFAVNVDIAWKVGGTALTVVVRNSTGELILVTAKCTEAELV